MLGNVEQDAFRPVKLDLERAGAVAGLVHVMLAAQRLGLLRELLDVVDEDAEMVQAGIVETLADLVGLKPQDRQIDRPIAQMITVGEWPVGLADLLEIERLLIELGHRIGVFGGNGDMTQLGHILLLSSFGNALTHPTLRAGSPSPAMQE